jgi:hypothetical protein
MVVTVFLSIIDRFTKWAIVIPCDKCMNTTQLIDLLWNRVFSWVGLPVKIVGDRDTRLTASQMRALTKELRIRLSLSASYRPQTDGSTERFNRTFLTMLRTASPEQNLWHTIVPALLYAYNNTVHSATGYTPHFLLHGWHPIDLRVPLAFQTQSQHPDIDSYLSARTAEFAKAQKALNKARQVMIQQRNASANAHVYAVGDLVKISSRVLQPRSLCRKLQPLYVGPFEVTCLLGPKTLSVSLPDSYHVNNAFNFEDVRPWLSHDAHRFEPNYPVVHAHESNNPIVKILNRRRVPGRLPSGIDLQDIPAQYQVLRRNEDVEWLPLSSSLFEDPKARSLVASFEIRYPRDSRRPCDGLEAYSDDEGESPDEYPLALHEDLMNRM